MDPGDLAKQIKIKASCQNAQLVAAADNALSALATDQENSFLYLTIRHARGSLSQEQWMYRSITQLIKLRVYAIDYTKLSFSNENKWNSFLDGILPRFE